MPFAAVSLQTYFNMLGFEVPPNENAADYYLDVVTRGISDENDQVWCIVIHDRPLLAASCGLTGGFQKTHAPVCIAAIG